MSNMFNNLQQRIEKFSARTSTPFFLFLQVNGRYIGFTDEKNNKRKENNSNDLGKNNSETLKFKSYAFLTLYKKHFSRNLFSEKKFTKNISQSVNSSSGKSTLDTDFFPPNIIPQISRVCGFLFGFLAEFYSSIITHPVAGLSLHRNQRPHYSKPRSLMGGCLKECHIS